MAYIAIQMESKNTSSINFNGSVIVFFPIANLNSISEALITDDQWKNIEPAIRNFPYKIDRTGTGDNYVSVNTPRW